MRLFPRSAGTLLGALTACSSSIAPIPTPDLPLAVTNNAVAIDTSVHPAVIYSTLGIDSTLQWSGITTRAFRLTLGNDRWEELPRVPGAVGRIAATAQVVGGQFILIGGYTVDSAGVEVSVPDVNIYDADRGEWVPGAPMPVPVDDAVSGVWRDSLIYLVSGWHDTDNVTAVQVYDPTADQWLQATPTPGPGVFGHTGGVVGDEIVYIDGVTRNPDRPRFRLIKQTWRGRIDPATPLEIRWDSLAPPHGPARYRAAAGICGADLVFVGGTDNPYNYNGIGYDGRSSEPILGGFTYRREGDAWLASPAAPLGTMDHRGLIVSPQGTWIIGGMRSGQRVASTMVPVPWSPC